MKTFNDKNSAKDSISFLTNKLESCCTHKKSFSKNNNNKDNKNDENILPSIINTKKYKNNFINKDGMKKMFNTNNSKIK